MRKHTQIGFTIVELLIVIVVIGILAAITVVAYNGLQNRAKVAAVSSDLSGATKILGLHEVDAGRYPATLAEANGGQGVKASDGTTYQYSTTGATYCLTATNGTVSYKVSSDSLAPTQGGCAGHGVGGVAAITNLATNPSFESSLLGVNSFSVSNSRPALGDAASGTYVLRSTRTGTSGTNGPWWDAAAVTEGRAYRVSLSTRANHTLARGLTIEWLNSAKSSILSTSSLATTTPTASWTVISGSATAPTGAAFMRLTFYGSGTGLTTDYVDIDGVIITEGTAQYAFADGQTANWVWNGTTNLSTSTGPPQ